MEIRPWKKIGKPKVLATSHGRSLLLQKFEDPFTHKIEEYSSFIGATFACYVLGVTENNDVLITRQYRQATDNIFLELPGGIPKYKNQPPMEVALREFAEETGGYVPDKILYLANDPIWLDPPSFRSCYYPFLFTGCQKTNMEIMLDQGEYIELVQIPLQDWISRCFSGQIPDSRAVTVTALALNHLGIKLNY